ncbi:MAG: phage tail sheath family protein [Saccharothrix sp.]|nr:phage tail sheath family protein [Saccharothrix sp.]
MGQVVPVRSDPLGADRVPGVAIEWLDAAPQYHDAVPTDVAGFVGIAERGPLHRAVRVDNWDQFRGVFGTRLPHAYLAYAVEGFFANGGRRCWVVRVADPTTARAAEAAARIGDGRWLKLAASSPGEWGNDVAFRLEPEAGGVFGLRLWWGDVVEAWHGLSVPVKTRADDQADDRARGSDAVAVLNHPVTGSRLVAASWESKGPAPTAHGRLAGGTDGLAGLRRKHFIDEKSGWGVAALGLVEDVSLVSVPDCWSPSAARWRRPRRRCPYPGPVDRKSETRAEFDHKDVVWVQQKVLDHCEEHQDRVALLDAPRFDRHRKPVDRAAVLAWRRDFRSSFAALYHPWVVAPDGTPGGGTVVPPSGHVAGLCAAGDTAIGVHKAPAGEALKLAVDTAAEVDDLTHGELVAKGVNVLRASRGVRVLGNRTSTVTDSPLRRLNVRRLMVALEEQIRRETAWAVFETASLSLCGDVERAVRGVLEDAWRSGRLAGPTSEVAYSVRCDHTVNPPTELAKGRVTCVIAVLPPQSAERLVLRLVRTPAGVLTEKQPGG